MNRYASWCCRVATYFTGVSLQKFKNISECIVSCQDFAFMEINTNICQWQSSKTLYKKIVSNVIVVVTILGSK